MARKLQTAKNNMLQTASVSLEYGHYDVGMQRQGLKGGEGGGGGGRIPADKRSPSPPLRFSSPHRGCPAIQKRNANIRCVRVCVCGGQYKSFGILVTLFAAEMEIYI